MGGNYRAIGCQTLAGVIVDGGLKGSTHRRQKDSFLVQIVQFHGISHRHQLHNKVLICPFSSMQNQVARSKYFDDRHSVVPLGGVGPNLCRFCLKWES